MNITYVGRRSPGGRADVFVEERHADGFVSVRRLDPDQSRRLRDHSPDGFEWGYGGSGPSQLALAILYDAAQRHQVRQTVAAEMALRFYQAFKFEYVANFPREGFRLSLIEDRGRLFGFTFTSGPLLDSESRKA